MVKPAMFIESHDVVVFSVAPETVHASFVCTAE